MNNAIPKGVILFSKVTEILYKMEKGVLMKYPTYAGANKCWEKSAYSKEFKHMKEATQEELNRILKKDRK